MPKTRNTTIANRGSSSDGAGGVGGASGDNESNEEMSDRIEERMEDSMTVDVDMYSATRDTQERLGVAFNSSTPGRAVVTSASGNAYEVDMENETCTCPNHVHRGVRCRHIEGVAIAQEEVPQGFYDGTASAQDINVGDTLNRQIEAERAEEAHNATREFTDDNHFYSDNPEGFRADMDRLRNEPVPYEYENVLNGSDIGFGIELEFVDGDSDAIARELHGLGICGEPEMVRYHARGVPGKWKLERDGSVTRGRMGGELVSPILKDTPETWRDIETICDVARRHGARVNTRTGGHVHVSTEPLDGKRQRWRRLFKTFKGTEESIFRLSGGELGSFRDTGYSESSEYQMSSAMRTRLPEEGSMRDFGAALNRGVRFERYSSINMIPFANGTREAVEIRAFNGTLTPGIIQANVKTSVGLVHAAERSRKRGIGEGLTTPSFQRRAEMIDNHQTSQTDADMMKMLDVYFTRKSDKEHILNVLSKNSWR